MNKHTDQMQNTEFQSVDFDITEHTLTLKNSLVISNAETFLKMVSKALRSYDRDILEIDLSQLEKIDSVGVATLNFLEQQLSGRGITLKRSGGNEGIQKKIDLFSLTKSETSEQKKRSGFFESVGEAFQRFLNQYVRRFLILSANVLYWSVTDIFRSKAQRKGEFFNQAVLIGVNAVWIVAAMAFIIGLVLALQSAAQLRNFGANIYIVDLIVIAMMSEMGPLITAILIAGRSGSSIAAEIATMKVTSELDALKTMGLHPVRFTVIPKMHGSIVTIPFLTILADLMGILGGIIIAWFYLDITPQVFLNRMAETLNNKDIVTGVIKSLVFAVIIVLTGSFYGLNVKQGAEGVGKVTTRAVVVSISLVFIADSIMGLIFY
jgi:phospholipid/cholesterol/gamma-HCH transport system permease protein